MITLIRTHSNQQDFKELVVLLDQELMKHDGDEHSFFAQFNTLDDIDTVLVAYHNAVAVGCGAIKSYSARTAEVKRMYVRVEQRGKGIAGQLLLALEQWARELGYTDCLLETGLKQKEAVRLYHKMGYRQVPNYGPYIGVESSICFSKPLL